jgi:GT2 family glycosyltransferase
MLDSISPSLSIVVASYTLKRLPDLLVLLESIRGQRHSDLEVVFVSDGNRELASEIETRAPSLGLSLRVVFNAGPRGLSGARNVGLQAARAEIVAFLDDDVVLSPEWTGQVVAAFEDPSVVGVTGPAFPLWDDESLNWVPEEFYWLLSCTGWTGWEYPREVRNAWGMDMAFRRRDLVSAGGFSSHLGLKGAGGPVAEDVEFALRVRASTGGKILYLPKAQVWHRVHRYRLSLRYILQRSYEVGRSRWFVKRLSDGLGLNGSLADERTLLSRMFNRTFPLVLRGLFRRPRIAVRQGLLAASSLAAVTAGFVTGAILAWPRVAKHTTHPELP